MMALVAFAYAIAGAAIEQPQVSELSARTQSLEPLPQSLDIYLLMGQSNMSGRGALEVNGAHDQTSTPQIWLFGNDGQWSPAQDPLDSAKGQIDMVSADAAAGVGPGMRFASTLSTKTRRPIGLVPCAKGGSSISQWQPGLTSDTLYGSCLNRARQAVAHGRIAGILWYQGESDTKTQAAASVWASEFSNMLSAFRRDLGQPNLPVVAVSLADPPPARPEYAFWKNVQKAQTTLDLSCLRIAKASGLELQRDGLHLSTRAQHILGSRIALQMAELRQVPDCR
jgi:Carbohydrate esterase, sialic acid-specific acetylesterase